MSCLEGRTAFHTDPSKESRESARRPWTVIFGIDWEYREGTSVAFRSALMGTCIRVSPIYYRLVGTELFKRGDVFHMHSSSYTSKSLFAINPNPFPGKRNEAI